MTLLPMTPTREQKTTTKKPSTPLVGKEGRILERRVRYSVLSREEETSWE